MTDLLDRAADAVDGAADAFAVLGLPRRIDLTDEDVRRAYRARMRALHPDAGGDADAAAAVTAAYDALRSAVRRGELLAEAMIWRSDPALREQAGARQSSRPDPARRARLRATVAAGRHAQGLPPQITDPGTLARIAELMTAVERGAPARQRAPLPAGADWRPALTPAPARVSAWRSEGRRRFMRDYEQREARAVDAVQAAGPSRWREVWAQIQHGRPVWLAARIVLAGGLVTGAQLAAPGNPAVPALAVGGVTWLVLTGRLDLAPRSRG
jgi:curved DNA-binding protein CbpA